MLGSVSAVALPIGMHPMNAPVPAEPRFGPGNKMRSSLDFAEMKAHGTTFRGAHCILVVLPKPGEPTRVGFITSKKSVGGAVQRNRARRRLREIIRLRWPRIPAAGYWLVVIALRGALKAPHQELANDVEHALAAAGALAPIDAPDEAGTVEAR